MHAIVPRLSGTPGEIRTPAPALGQHNDEILGALGCSTETIASLRKRKII
jgi:formyl-CoA transferase